MDARSAESREAELRRRTWDGQVLVEWKQFPCNGFLVLVRYRDRGYHRRKFRHQTSENRNSEEKVREETIEEKVRESQKDADARKGNKVARHGVFRMVCFRSRLAKAAGAELAGQMSDGKLHVVVAQSTCRSENVQSTSGPRHFWKLRCGKGARRFGAEHMSKSKCKRLTVSDHFWDLLDIGISKKCTRLWREAHVQVKMHKARHARATIGCSGSYV